MCNCADVSEVHVCMCVFTGEAKGVRVRVRVSVCVWSPRLLSEHCTDQL